MKKTTEMLAAAKKRDRELSIEFWGMVKQVGDDIINAIVDIQLEDIKNSMSKNLYLKEKKKLIQKVKNKLIKESNEKT